MQDLEDAVMRNIQAVAELSDLVRAGTRDAAPANAPGPAPSVDAQLHAVQAALDGYEGADDADDRAEWHEVLVGCWDAAQAAQAALAPVERLPTMARFQSLRKAVREVVQSSIAGQGGSQIRTPNNSQSVLREPAATKEDTHNFVVTKGAEKVRTSAAGTRKRPAFEEVAGPAKRPTPSKAKARELSTPLETGGKKGKGKERAVNESVQVHGPTPGLKVDVVVPTVSAINARREFYILHFGAGTTNACRRAPGEDDARGR
ncbi:hypothetical protein DFH11DRAFT_1620451 [Phellopilus nigrolimitatus]|nr:hypothetical protein DFH11DRAFT_1620451 [Phellopilus nigrolimitatus]